MSGSVIGALIIVVGWAATHVLTLRAQRKNFENQILDRARMEIVRALRAYEEWLGRLAVLVLTLESAFIGERVGVGPADWRSAITQIRDLIDDRKVTTDWSIALEEYEILFPEVRDVRAQLLLRQREFFTFASEVSSTLTEIALFPGDLASREARVAKLKEKLSSLWEQQALLDDLRIHLQNVSLARIVDRRVSERMPTDPDVLRIIPGKGGMLVIVRHGDAPPPPGVATRDADGPTSRGTEGGGSE